jgi:hypothetical protein
VALRGLEYFKKVNLKCSLSLPERDHAMGPSATLLAIMTNDKP